MVDIRFIEGGEELLDKVGPLWQRLNEHHQKIALHFSEQFRYVTFNQRKNYWLEKSKPGQIRIDLARLEESDIFVGYCLTIITPNFGEIESIFVDEGFRKRGIGHYLITKALNWMDCQSVIKKRVNVAVGNEQVFSFYERYGFFPRVTTLEQIASE